MISNSVFDPLVWFVCRFCRQAFPDMDRLKKHKLKKHLEDCGKIKCIIFEERLLDRPWIPNDNIYLEPVEENEHDSPCGSSNDKNDILPDRPFCLCDCNCHNFGLGNPNRLENQSNPGQEPQSATKTIPRSSRSEFTSSKNPYVSLTRLTSKELEDALGADSSLLRNVLKKNLKRLGDKEDHRKSPSEPPVKKSRVRDNIQETTICNRTDTPTLESESESPVEFDAVIDDEEEQEEPVSASASNPSFVFTDAEAELTKNTDTNLDLDNDNDSLPNPTSPASNASYFSHHDDEQAASTADNDEEDNEPRYDLRVSTSIFQDPTPCNSPSKKQDSHTPSESSSFAPMPLIITLESDEEGGEEKCDEIPTDSDESVISNYNCKLKSKTKRSLSKYGRVTRSKSSLVSKEKSKSPLKSAEESKSASNSDTDASSDSVVYSSPKRRNRVKSNNSKGRRNNVRFRDLGPSRPSKFKLERTLPLFQWLKLQKEKQEKRQAEQNSNSTDTSTDLLILLDPDPTSLKEGFVIYKENPIECKLCRSKLRSEFEVRVHAENCWLHNKDRHIYCAKCERRFSNPSTLKKHLEAKHSASATESNNPEKENENNTNHDPGNDINIDLDLDLDQLPLGQWMKAWREKYPDVILLDPEPRLEESENQQEEFQFTRCLLCNKSLASELAVKEHVKMCWVYNKEEHRCCHRCKEFFSSSKILRIHKCADGELNPERKNTSESSFSCTYCRKKFKSKKNLERHENSAKYFFKFMQDPLGGIKGRMIHVTPIRKDLRNPPEYSAQNLSSSPQQNLQNLTLTEYLDLVLHQHNDSAESENNPTQPKNLILLDPFPFPSPSPSTSNVEITAENPVTCKLCLSTLSDESTLRNHVENCWLHNKPRHVYCHLCNITFTQNLKLSSHNKTTHLNLSRDLAPDSNPNLPLSEWLQAQKKDSTNVILLEPDPAVEKIPEISAVYPVKCVLCQLLLTSELLVRNHVRTCWKLNNVKHRWCIECSKDYKNRKRLKDHTRKKHPSKYVLPESSLTCISCNMTFSHKEDLTYHQSSKEEFFQRNGSPFPIRNRSKSSQAEKSTEKNNGSKTKGSLPDLFLWLQTERQLLGRDGKPKIILLDPEPKQNEPVEINEENPIKCLLCSRKLFSVQNVKIHVISCYTLNKFQHRYCLICQKSFERPLQYQNHFRLEHPEDFQREWENQNALFKCKLCLAEFCEESSFKAHEESHNNSTGNFNAIRGKGHLGCPKCPKHFKSKAQLLRHMIQHGRKTQFKCRLCDKYFANQRTLNDHEATHIAEKNFKCPVETCSGAFTSEKLLDHHKKSIHSGELGLKQFLCSVCGQVFGLQGHLNRHWKIAHTEERPYKCSVEGCGKAFKQGAPLKEHMRLHTGETPFQCHECGKAFARVWGLQKHQRMHEGTTNKVMCHLCPKKYAGTWELKKHLKKDHDHDRDGDGEDEGARRISKPKPKFKCQFCWAECATKLELKKHEKCHENFDDSSTEEESESE